MSDTHPGVEDEVEHALRLGLATAAQLADRFARARQELARDVQRRSDDEHRQLEARFRAEGASAAARLSVVERAEWWNRATSQQIVSMYELAHQWRDDQPDAANAADTIAHQVHDRYGINASNPNADAEGLRAALAQAEIDRATRNNPAAATERPDDLATAMATVVRAERRDAALEATAAERISREQGAEPSHTENRAAQEPAVPGPAYDTHERRSASAAQMREAGLADESIAVATRADIAHAHPADMATAGRTTPHVTVGRSVDRGSHRSGRSR